MNPETGEEEEIDMIFDSQAYEMLHRAKVEWPCLSLDFMLPERWEDPRTYRDTWFPNHISSLDPAMSETKDDVKVHKNDKYPYTVYLAAGSQAQKRSDNRIYVMKWTNMAQTLKPANPEESDSDEPEEEQPSLMHEIVPHKGGVNRLRTMHGSSIIATWNDEAEVAIYDVK
jgi:ribosome assembly protein RRB1